MMENMIIGRAYKFKSAEDQLAYSKLHDCNEKYAKIISSLQDGTFIVTAGNVGAGEGVQAVSSATDLHGNNIRTIEGYMIINSQELKYFVEVEIKTEQPDDFVLMSMDKLLRIYMDRHPGAIESKITVSGLRRWYDECKKEISEIEKAIEATELHLTTLKNNLQSLRELVK